MNKIFFSIVCLFIVHTVAMGQVTVTVTNPTNTTPNLAASYASLANAVAAVNAITAMSGPVILTCASGNETAPAGGYSINSPGGTSATNTITFTTSGTVTITASASLTAGSLTDAIFKLIGADYITINGFTMQENPANTTTTLASNNMTEWGVALLYASTTNGSQNNIIQDNTISLLRTYPNSFGIYSNTRHSSTNTGTIADIANSTTAPNSNNKFYGNTISNVNNGITLVGSGVSANQDQGNDIGGSSAATGNTITNWGGDLPTGGFISIISVMINGILINNQNNENVSYNTIVSATVTLIASSGMTGIEKFHTIQPTGTITSTISHNTVTVKSNTTANFTFAGAIRTEGMTALSTATINVNDNIVMNCTETGASSPTGCVAIRNNSAPGVLNMNNNIIKGNTSTGNPFFFGLQNSGAVITTLNINNNQLGIAGSGLFSYTAPATGTIMGINNSNAASTCTVNINGNSIDGISAQSCGVVYGILNGGSFPASVININNNQLGSVTGTFASFSAAQSNPVMAIYHNGGNASTNVFVQNNDFRNIVHTVAGTGIDNYIIAAGANAAQTVSSNTFTNITFNTTGGIFLISGPGNMAATASWTCTNNSIAGSFNKTSTGGGLTCISTSGSSATGSTLAITDNNFSNITIADNTGFSGISDQSGSFSSGPTKTISGNTFSNIVSGSGGAGIISFDYGMGITCSSNTINGFTSTGTYVGIGMGFSINGNVNCSNNTVSNITTTAIFAGFSGGSTTVPALNINGNTFNSITCPNSTVINISSGALVNIYDNTISNLNSSSGAAVLKGIQVFSCAAANVYRNKLYGFSVAAGGSSGVPCIYGMFMNSVVTTTVNVYNNFVAGFTAPSFSGADLIHGIHIGSATASTTYNVYYNSVYLNASSTGINFGTCALYHLVNSTATTNTLNLIDNIIVNTSTPAGTGKTTAFQRSSSVSLNNYATTSDYNLFYAGTPSASRLIYYDGTNSDQTLAAFQTRVSTRDANDISVMPNFTSNTDLHLTSANCLIDGKGTPIATYTTDVDNVTRNVSTPDIGADEFTSSSGTTAATTASCDNKIVAGAGTTYMNSSCELIALVLPSGGAPVSGNINACVTLDATQQTFNGEPYVQRHFDIEPATSNQTTTSATITLYFTDAEFALYNTTNAVTWPRLPTVANGGNADANRVNLKVTQFHGAATTSPSSPGNYPGTRVLINPGATNVFWNGNLWEVSFNVAGFSGFYVHTNNFNAPLPIIVNYLTGRRLGSNHLLNWKVTCTSTPRATMTLERSSDGRNYSDINRITADAARCQQPFDYTDINPLKGMNYYRLKTVDADGRVTYSTTVALLNAVKGFDIISIAPNPVVDGNFKLNVTSAQSGKMDISIFDMQGRLVSRQTLSLIVGFNSIPVSVGNLQPGTYALRGGMADDQFKVVRFVKQ